MVLACLCPSGRPVVVNFMPVHDPLAVALQAYATNCYLTTTQQANRLLQVLC